MLGLKACAERGYAKHVRPDQPQPRLCHSRRQVLHSDIEVGVLAEPAGAEHRPAQSRHGRHPGAQAGLAVPSSGGPTQARADALSGDRRSRHRRSRGAAVTPEPRASRAAPSPAHAARWPRIGRTSPGEPRSVFSPVPPALLIYSGAESDRRHGGWQEMPPLSNGSPRNPKKRKARQLSARSCVESGED